jgi:hypothetical protein
LPPVAPPLPIEIDPLLPDDVVPELKLNTPLTPAVPAFALRITIAPLDVSTPIPEVISIHPPVPKPEQLLSWAFVLLFIMLTYHRSDSSRPSHHVNLSPVVATEVCPCDQIESKPGLDRQISEVGTNFLEH